MIYTELDIPPNYAQFNLSIKYDNIQSSIYVNGHLKNL